MSKNTKQPTQISEGSIFYRILAILSLVVPFTLAPIFSAFSAEVTLGWDASPSPGVAGYKVYVRVIDGSYGPPIDVGNQLWCTIKDLSPQQTYCFSATAYDGSGVESAFSQEISYTVPGINTAPVSNDGTLSAREDTPVWGLLSASDEDGDALTFRIVRAPAKGRLRITDAAKGRYVYIPAANATGPDAFRFRVTDGISVSNTATVSIAIAPFNDPPMALNGQLRTRRNTPVRGRLRAKDADGNRLTYRIARRPLRGRIIAFDPRTGIFTYLPKLGFTGMDTFGFKARDGRLESKLATTRIRVVPPTTAGIQAAVVDLPSSPAHGRNRRDSGGSFISVVASNLNPNGQLQPEEFAEYEFEIPAPGEYKVWGRVMTAGPAGNAFLLSLDDGPALQWVAAIGAAHSWVWDQVRANGESGAASFTLDQGRHRIRINPEAAGAAVDSLIVTNDPDYFDETIYEDAEDSLTAGWLVLDSGPPGAKICNIYDAEAQSRVVQLTGSGTANGYRLLSDGYKSWANSSQFGIGWSMKFSEPFAAIVGVETTGGKRWLIYSPVAGSSFVSERRIHVGLGHGLIDGQWRRFIRDLQQDLWRAQPGVTILRVNEFSVRGSGSVDDIRLRARACHALWEPSMLSLAPCPYGGGHPGASSGPDRHPGQRAGPPPGL